MYKIIPIQELKKHRIYRDYTRNITFSLSPCDFCKKQEENCLQFQLTIFVNDWLTSFMKQHFLYFCSEECINIWVIQNYSTIKEYDAKRVRHG